MPKPDRIAQVDPTETARLIADGALLLDVRELDEWAVDQPRPGQARPSAQQWTASAAGS